MPLRNNKSSKSVEAIVDLETISPVGRIDVLLYNLAKHGIKYYESASGLNGIWDNVRNHVNEGIYKGLSGVEMPSELRIILGIIQSNMNKEDKYVNTSK